MANNVFISDTAANTMMDAANGLPGLLSGGTCKIYSGLQPANANQSIGSATLLSTLTFANPAFGAPSAGVSTASGLPLTDNNIAATGTASWFRLWKSDGITAVLDGTVGTSGCDMNLNSTTLVAGGTLTITAFTITMPEH